MVEVISEFYIPEIKCIDGTYVAPDFLIDAIENLSFASEYKPRTADVILKNKISNKIFEMLGADVIYSETKYAEHLEEVRIKKQIEEKLGLSLAEIKKVL